MSLLEGNPTVNQGASVAISRMCTRSRGLGQPRGEGLHESGKDKGGNGY